MIYEQLLVTPNVRFDVEVEININDSEDKLNIIKNVHPQKINLKILLPKCVMML